MITKKGFEEIADLIAIQFLWGKFEDDNIDNLIEIWCQWGHRENPNFNNIIFAKRIKEYIKNTKVD